MFPIEASRRPLFVARTRLPLLRLEGRSTIACRSQKAEFSCSLPQTVPEVWVGDRDQRFGPLRTRFPAHLGDAVFRHDILSVRARVGSRSFDLRNDTRNR